MKYKTEKEIFELIKNFEKCTIERGTWGHPEHLIIAFNYASNYDFETALSKMRDGIFRLLRSFEIDLTKEMPYHETLTVFWMMTVFGFANTDNSQKDLVASVGQLIEKFDKEYPLRFYTREFLFSDRAREVYLPGDLKPGDLTLSSPELRNGEITPGEPSEQKNLRIR